MSLSRITRLPIQWVYLLSDLIVLSLSLCYIPLGKIAYSLLTVILSGQLIGIVERFDFRLMKREGLRPALVDYADAKKKDATLTGGSMSTTNAAHWPQVMLDS